MKYKNKKCIYSDREIENKIDELSEDPENFNIDEHHSVVSSYETLKKYTDWLFGEE